MSWQDGLLHLINKDGLSMIIVRALVANYIKDLIIKNGFKFWFATLFNFTFHFSFS